MIAKITFTKILRGYQGESLKRIFKPSKNTLDSPEKSTWQATAGRFVWLKANYLGMYLEIDGLVQIMSWFGYVLFVETTITFWIGYVSRIQNCLINEYLPRFISLLRSSPFPCGYVQHLVYQFKMWLDTWVTGYKHTIIYFWVIPPKGFNLFLGFHQGHKSSSCYWLVSESLCERF